MKKSLIAMVKTAIFMGVVLGGYKVYDKYFGEKTLDFTKKVKGPSNLTLDNWGNQDSMLSSITQEDWAGIHG